MIAHVTDDYIEDDDGKRWANPFTSSEPIPVIIQFRNTAPIHVSSHSPFAQAYHERLKEMYG